MHEERFRPQRQTTKGITCIIQEGIINLCRLDYVRVRQSIAGSEWLICVAIVHFPPVAIHSAFVARRKIAELAMADRHPKGEISLGRVV